MKKLGYFFLFLLLHTKIYAQIGVSPIFSVAGGTLQKDGTVVDYEIPHFFESNILLNSPEINTQTAINFGFMLLSEPETNKVKAVLKDSLILATFYKFLEGDLYWTRKWDLSKPVYTWDGITLFPNGAVKTISLKNNNIKGVLTTAKDYPDQEYPLDSLFAVKSVLIGLDSNYLDFVHTQNFVKTINNHVLTPQMPLGLEVDTTGVIGQEMNFYTFVRELPDANNRYQWYKNGKALDGQTTFFLKIRSLSLTDSGTYSCKVTNPLVTSLTLQRADIHLRVTPPISGTDSLALVKFWQATNGKEWVVTWDLQQPVASWKGLVFENGKVLEMSLPENNLVGRIPSEIFDSVGIFKELNYINLSRNALKDSIPFSFSKLKKLNYLDLSANQFNYLPKNLQLLENLKTVWLNENFFTEIPDQIAQLKNVESLFFQKNKISTISEKISELKNLKILDVSQNQLAQIPSSLAQIPNLEQLFLSNNQLNTLPDFQNTKLKVLELQNNQFKELPNLPVLQSLNIANNLLNFGDLEKLADRKPLYFVYSPQAPIGNSYDTLLLTDQRFEMSLQTEGVFNTYQWQRNTLDLPNATFTNLIFERTKAEDAGSYRCLVKNTKFPDLTLQTKTITVRTVCGGSLQITINTADSLNYCPQSSIFVKLSAKTTRADAIVRWYKNDIQIYAPARLDYFASEAGVYRAEILDNNGCSNFSNELKITVRPTTPFSITNESNRLFIKTGKPEKASYQWFLNEKPIIGATSADFVAKEHGSYFLVITTSEGCQLSSQNRILLDATAVEDDLEKKPTVWIYPNPTADFLRVEISKTFPNSRFRLWSNLGKEYEILATELEKGIFRLDVSHLGKGIYWLEISSQDAKLYRQFIKE